MPSAFPSTIRCQSIKQHYQTEINCLLEKVITINIQYCNEEIFFIASLKRTKNWVIMYLCKTSCFENIIMYEIPIVLKNKHLIKINNNKLVKRLIY